MDTHGHNLFYLSKRDGFKFETIHKRSKYILFCSIRIKRIVYIHATSWKSQLNLFTSVTRFYIFHENAVIPLYKTPSIYHHHSSEATRMNGKMILQSSLLSFLTIEIVYMTAGIKEAEDRRHVAVEIHISQAI